jgi:hypothetical protein
MNETTDTLPPPDRPSSAPSGSDPAKEKVWPDAYCPTSERDDAVRLYNETEKKRREEVAALRFLLDKTERELLDATASLKGQRELAATHRCKVCGALWICFSDSWSLASQKCGPCCDNQPMDAQIEAVGVYGEMEKRWQTLWETSEANVNRWYSRAKLSEKRLHWLHDCNNGSTDAEGFEWGIYRVKWEDGKVAQLLHTFSDFSDLDAEMAREQNTQVEPRHE